MRRIQREQCVVAGGGRSVRWRSLHMCIFQGLRPTHTTPHPPLNPKPLFMCHCLPPLLCWRHQDLHLPCTWGRVRLLGAAHVMYGRWTLLPACAGCWYSARCMHTQTISYTGACIHTARQCHGKLELVLNAPNTGNASTPSNQPYAATATVLFLPSLQANRCIPLSSRPSLPVCCWNARDTHAKISAQNLVLDC